MRSLNLRSLQGLVAVAAVFVLTGAKGNGCGGSESEPPVEPPVIVDCAEGFHLETICEDSCDGQCTEECVPDSACPEGSYEEWVCGPVALELGMPDCDPDGEGCVPPPPAPEECWLACTPIDPCGPDAHEEWICEGVVEPDPSDPDQPVSEACYPICVSNTVCEPGYHEEWFCDGVVDEENGGGGQADDPSGCYPACVPDLCPPDTYETTVCEGWDGEGEPPPQDLCWTECVSPSICPPGQHEEEVCYPEGMGAPCQIICVDDGQVEPI